MNVSIGCSGSRLLSQRFGRPRWDDHWSPGVQDQAGQHRDPVSSEPTDTTFNAGNVHDPIQRPSQQLEAGHP